MNAVLNTRKIRVILLFFFYYLSSTFTIHLESAIEPTIYGEILNQLNDAINNKKEIAIDDLSLDLLKVYKDLIYKQLMEQIENAIVRKSASQESLAELPPPPKTSRPLPKIPPSSSQKTEISQQEEKIVKGPQTGGGAMKRGTPPPPPPKKVEQKTLQKPETKPETKETKKVEVEKKEIVAIPEVNENDTEEELIQKLEYVIQKIEPGHVELTGQVKLSGLIRALKKTNPVKADELATRLIDKGFKSLKKVEVKQKEIEQESGLFGSLQKEIEKRRGSMQGEKEENESDEEEWK